MSTESPNEFEGNKPGIKLSLQEEYWVIEHGQKKYSYSASESGSLPLGENVWSTETVFKIKRDSTIEIKELLCGKNPGYVIKENGGVNFRTPTTTAENCYGQVL